MAPEERILETNPYPRILFLCIKFFSPVYNESKSGQT